MSSKKQSYIVFTFFLIILIILAVFCGFLIKEIKKSSESYLVTKKELLSIEPKIESFKSIEIQHLELQPDLERIKNMFINPEVPINFVEFLEKTALKTNTSIKISLPPQKVEEFKGFSSLLFQISSYGSFSNFSKFLEILKNSSYLINFEALNVKRLEEKELSELKLNLGDVAFNFSIRVLSN